MKNIVLRCELWRGTYNRPTAYPRVLQIKLRSATSRHWMASSSGTVRPWMRYDFIWTASSVCCCVLSTIRITLPMESRAKPYFWENICATVAKKKKHQDRNKNIKNRSFERSETESTLSAWAWPVVFPHFGGPTTAILIGTQGLGLGCLRYFRGFAINVLRFSLVEKK